VPTALSTKEQIMLAGERLIADHGVEGVSMRQIAAEVGSGNNSAVLYHFGSKEKLVKAIFEYRLPRLRERRATLIAERHPSDLRGWLGCQVTAVFEQSEVAGSAYLSFIASLIQHGSDAFRHQPKRFLRAQSEYQDRMLALMHDVDEPLRSHRLAQVMTLIVQSAAARERARARRQRLLPLALEIANMTDGAVAFLTAPVSADAHAALAATRVDTASPVLLV
jgi:AcrR family transcriptional regulator